MQSVRERPRFYRGQQVIQKDPNWQRVRPPFLHQVRPSTRSAKNAWPTRDDLLFQIRVPRESAGVVSRPMRTNKSAKGKSCVYKTHECEAVHKDDWADQTDDMGRFNVDWRQYCVCGSAALWTVRHLFDEETVESLSRWRDSLQTKMFQNMRKDGDRLWMATAESRFIPAVKTYT